MPVPLDLMLRAINVALDRQGRDDAALRSEVEGDLRDLREASERLRRRLSARWPGEVAPRKIFDRIDALRTAVESVAKVSPLPLVRPPRSESGKTYGDAKLHVDQEHVWWWLRNVAKVAKIDGKNSALAAIAMGIEPCCEDSAQFPRRAEKWKRALTRRFKSEASDPGRPRFGAVSERHSGQR